MVRESSKEGESWRDRKIGRERGPEENGGGSGGKGKKRKTGEMVGDEGIWGERRVKL